MASDKEVRDAIMNGITFGGGGFRPSSGNPDKVKTKARKKAYQTGAHGSGAAKHKAEIRQRVKNRPTQRKK